jgi:hypothetical protein
MADATEIWLPVSSWEDIYEVSSLGRVRGRTRRGHRGDVMSPQPNSQGYLRVMLRRAPKWQHRFVHHLVIEAFTGPRPPGAIIRHLDGDHLNNAASNLAYGTRSENALDATRHGHNRNALKTHCPRGHPYAGANLQIRVLPNGGYGGRSCRTCGKRASDEWQP